MSLELLLFYFFSFALLVSSLMVISARNPIHSVLFLVLVFCNAAGLFLLLQVEFLAMIFLVVYVGAVAVLFLFVVMMLNIKVIEVNESLLRYLPIGIAIGFIFLTEVFLILNGDMTPIVDPSWLTSVQLQDWSSQIRSLSNIEVIGQLIYTHYFYGFIVASLILLVAMIGAIVLTLNRREFVKKQDVFDQISRSYEDAVKLKS